LTSAFVPFPEASKRKEGVVVIEIPRALARQVRAVLRRSVVEQEPRGEWPLLLCRADARGLCLQAQRNEVALCYQAPGKQEADTLAFRASLLEEFDGRGKEPVTLEAVELGKGRARWIDGSVPRQLDFETVTPDSVPAFPALPRQWTPLPASFLQALDEAGRTTAKESVRYALTRLQLRGQAGELIATDGRQLLIQRGFPFPWTEDVLIPRLSVFGSRELAGETDVAVGRTRSPVAVRVGAWIFLLAIDTTSRYPNAADVVPKAHAGASRLQLHPSDAEFLVATLPKLPGAQDHHSPVTLGLNGSVTIRARAEGQERITELVLARSTASGSPVQVNCDRHFLIRAARFGFTEVQVVKVDTPVVCRDGQRLYLWMPLDARSALAASPDALRIVSAEEPLPAHSPPMERKETVMPVPPSNGHGANNGHSQDQTPERWGIAEVIAETEALRAVLQDASARTARLLAALKHQRRQSRAVQQAMQSLKQLQLGS
jgi:hypothetical protein